MTADPLTLVASCTLKVLNIDRAQRDRAEIDPAGVSFFNTC